jgi:hypothetical protein
LARQARFSDKLTQQGNEVSDLVILAAGHLAMAHGGEGEAKGQEVSIFSTTQHGIGFCESAH